MDKEWRHMATTLQDRPFVETLNGYLRRLEGLHKSAGDGRGQTSHPSEGAEDNPRPASEGSRSSENEKDVKNSVPAGGVNSASNNSGGSSDNMISVGMTPSATGEHSAVEDDYKDRAKDAPTSHPATTG